MLLINGLSVRILRQLQQHVLQLLHIYLHVPQAKPVPAAAVARGSRVDADCGPVGWIMDENGALFSV